MKCSECPYYWIDEDESEYPSCHYGANDGCAPCEQEDKERETEDIDEEPETVWLVSEENHGLIAVANSRESAIDFLISTKWINGCCELWNPNEGIGETIDDLFEDWAGWLTNTATDEDFENMGYSFRKWEVYTK